ncbi:MAG: TonB-dependent receptor [Pseudomonadota bacterium]|nr:MAG: TonB-dependent receptor [Pseudomonadota bacterium]
MNHKLPLVSLLAALSLPLPAQNPSADEMGDGPTAATLAESLDLDVLVVSATRTDRPRFSTPAAVSVLRREEIQVILPYAFQDVFESAAGVTVQGGPRRIAEEPAIRGFSDEQVVIRLDGSRQNFNKAHGGRFLLDPDLLRSVEILRGASSAVYGSGALGGVFALETVNGRDLTNGRDGIGVRLRGAYQQNADERSGFATGYGQSGRFDWLGSFVYRDAGEDLEDGNGNDILASRDEITNGLIKLGFEPGADHRIELAFDRFENEGLNPTNANSPATATNLVERNTERGGLRARYRFDPSGGDWLDLEASAYRNEVDTRERRLDDDRLDLTEFETTGLEIANTSRFGAIAGQPIRLTYGVEFFSDDQGGLRNGADRTQFPDAEVDYEATFVQAEIPLPGQISLIPGLRYDGFDYTANGFPNRDDSETSARVALGWAPHPSVYLWAEFAEAFRAPSLTELFADGVHFIVPLQPGQVVINEFVPTPNLRAEDASQVQAGLRWQSRDLGGTGLDLEFDVTWFESDVDDFVDQIVVFISGEPTFDPITQTLVFPGITTNRNVDARIRGIEASARLNAPRAYLKASLTTLDGERTDTGQNLAGIQPDRFSLTGGLRLLDRQLVVGAEFTAAGSRRNVPEGAIETAGYGKVDAFINYFPRTGALEGFEFRLSFDNLFDKDYRIHPNGINQPGRSVRLSLARDFQWLN